MPKISILSLNKFFSKKSHKLLVGEKDFKVLDGTRSFNEIEDILARHKVDIVVIEVADLQDLDWLRRLLPKGKDQKIIVMGEADGDISFKCIKSGVKGFIEQNISPNLLKKAIKVIYNGEVWFGRKTTSKVFEEFLKLAPTRGHPESIKCLSKREKEVLRLVAQGFKNRDIAESLYISETTVKTHLYHIFEKLGVEDRLKAALLVKEIEGHG